MQPSISLHHSTQEKQSLYNYKAILIRWQVIKSQSTKVVPSSREHFHIWDTNESLNQTGAY